MAVAEITRRHAQELAMAWWRRDTSALLQLQGRIEDFEPLDDRMSAYLCGAVLDPEAVFTDLQRRLNPSAADFVADLFAGLAVWSACGATKAGRSWSMAVSALPAGQQRMRLARRAVLLWLGVDGARPADRGPEHPYNPAEPIECVDSRQGADRLLHSHAAEDLRFIDALGRRVGHFELAAAHLATAPSSAGQLCSLVLLKPEIAEAELKAAVNAGHEPSVVYLAAAVSGRTDLLPWLVRSAQTPEMSLLALDAIRRITGFDAMDACDLNWALPARHKRSDLQAAAQAAKRWYDEQGSALPAEPCLLGLRRDHSQCLAVLRHGAQVDRELAAMLMIARMSPSEARCFPLRSHTHIQLSLLDVQQPDLQAMLPSPHLKIA